MLVRKVSKMGDKMRIVYLPTTEFHRGERVRIKAINRREYIYRRVASMGKYVVAVIPRDMWDIFPHRARVSVKKARGEQK